MANIGSLRDKTRQDLLMQVTKAQERERMYLRTHCRATVALVSATYQYLQGLESRLREFAALPLEARKENRQYHETVLAVLADTVALRGALVEATRDLCDLALIAGVKLDDGSGRWGVSELPRDLVRSYQQAIEITGETYTVTL